jgi:hypothetical protein
LIHRVLHSSIISLPRLYAKVSQSDPERAKVEHSHVARWRILRLSALRGGLLALSFLTLRLLASGRACRKISSNSWYSRYVLLILLPVVVLVVLLAIWSCRGSED